MRLLRAPILAAPILFLMGATPTPAPTPTTTPRPTAAPRNLSEYARSIRGRTPTPGSVSTYGSTVATPALALKAISSAGPEGDAPCVVPEGLKERSKTVVLRDPVEVSRTKPDYPKHLRAQRVQGEVVLAGVICRDGTVQKIEVLKAKDPRFVDPAVSSFRTWRYKPATLDGEPVPVYVTVVITFSLS